MIDFATVTARGLAADIRDGRLDPRAVAEAFRDRIDRMEPQIGAFTALADPVVGTAGALAGVPFGVKDVFDTRDLPTEYGSDIYKGWQPCRDAGAVHLVRQAGATVMGKTVTTEFATYAPRGTRNPHDPTRTPGGSSSGSAAALAAGMVLLAYGTQTAGSTIRPASFCGVVGMKPSRGLIDTSGMKPLGQSLDVVGPMARNVGDLALLCSVAMRRPELVETMEALPTMALFLPAHEGVDDSASRAVIEAAVARLGQVASVAVPDWWEALGRAHVDVFAWEASATLAPERDLHPDLLLPRTVEFLAGQRGSTHAGWLAGIAARDAALSRLDEIFGGRDLILTQAAPGEAPKGLEATGNAAFNIRWTLLGCPSLTLPAGVGPDGLPIGLQIVVRPGQDHLLLAAAALVEAQLAGV